MQHNKVHPGQPPGGSIAKMAVTYSIEIQSASFRCCSCCC